MAHLSVKNATRTPFQKQVQRIYAKLSIPYDPWAPKDVYACEEFLRPLLWISQKEMTWECTLGASLLPTRTWLEPGRVKAIWECRAMGTFEHESIAANFTSISSTNSWWSRDQATPRKSQPVNSPRFFVLGWGRESTKLGQHMFPNPLKTMILLSLARRASRSHRFPLTGLFGILKLRFLFLISPPKKKSLERSIDRFRVGHSHHPRLTKMFVELFWSGAVDSRPSRKCGILFVELGPAMRHRRLYRSLDGWKLDEF